MNNFQKVGTIAKIGFAVCLIEQRNQTKGGFHEPIYAPRQALMLYTKLLRTLLMCKSLA